MILLFGGTTEGRKAVEVLEEGGSPYYYSTKTGEQDIALHHGQRINGALDVEGMLAFCREHDIRLMVDAAHPFASQLHQTIAQVSEALNIPTIRYERIYPPRDPEITWIDDYSQVPTDIHSLLATTGVQSINRLKWLEKQGVRVVYRILNRESSIQLAHQQGATDDQLCFFDDQVVGEASKLCDASAVGEASKLCLVGEASKLCDVVGNASKRYSAPDSAAAKLGSFTHCGGTAKLGSFTHYDAILMKESGLSGGFQEKVEAAKQQGMRIIALKRPAIPQGFVTVNGPYGLRRAVEHLLPEFYPLHSGLTTGTCATAAAVAAMLSRQRLEALPTIVPVILPNGETIQVDVGYGDGYAYCIKEAGDDPDVTNGLEIRVSLTPIPSPKGEGDLITIEGGEGVGIFTLPGFDYPPGSPAINKAPREMIRQNLEAIVGNASKRYNVVGDASKRYSSDHEKNAKLGSFTHYIVTISVPGGEEIAKRTFNPRLGIEGGISIIGVSGIVKPFSEEAFIDSIRKCMEVAKAAFAVEGQAPTERVVINSGAKSERFLKARYPDLPSQAFVQYGNYIGETLKMADELRFKHVTLGVMLGKAVKLAQGHLDTHSRRATMDLDFVCQLLHEADCDVDISDITLARELWERLRARRSSGEGGSESPDGACTDRFVSTVIAHCAAHCQPLLPSGELTILLIDDDGNIYPKQ